MSPAILSERSDDSSGRYWITLELEQMVQWLEDPNNQAKFRKGSGLTKKAALTLLVNQLPNKTSQQVSDKYGNLKRAYAKAAQLNDQSGWGLMEEDLDEGILTQRSMRIGRKHSD